MRPDMDPEKHGKTWAFQKGCVVRFWLNNLYKRNHRPETELETKKDTNYIDFPEEIVSTIS